MRDTDYAYASAYTRTLENKMLSEGDIEVLLSASAIEDALRYLTEKGYGGEKKEKPLDIETLLREEFVHGWNEVKNACPKGAPIHILLYPSDFHNLKVILKSIFDGSDHRPLMFEPNTVPPDVIHRAVSEGKMESLPDVLKNHAIEAYHILARDNGGQLAEIYLDKALFTAMDEDAKQAKNALLVDWIDLNIAVMNMKVALRGHSGGKSGAFMRDSMLACKRLNADELAETAVRDAASICRFFFQSGFEKVANAARESVAVFEKALDDELIRFAGAARTKLFGFETIFGFLIGKQYEIQAVRMILSGLRGGIPAGSIRERLRDIYA